MKRTDYRFNRSERSLEPPDDEEPDEAREDARARDIERRIDDMREEGRCSM